MNTVIKTINGELPYGFSSFLQLYQWFKKQGNKMVDTCVHEYMDRNGNLQKNEYAVPYLKVRCFDEMTANEFSVQDLRDIEMSLHQSCSSRSSHMDNIKMKIREMLDLKYRLGDY